MKYPEVILGGQTFDIYDIAEAFGVTSPPLFNAFKKIIRRGNGAKTERQDLEEAKQSIDRYLRNNPAPPKEQPPEKPDGVSDAEWHSLGCSAREKLVTRMRECAPA